MKTEAIIKMVSEIPAGRFFRVRYLSKVRIKSDYEKQGYSLFKLVDTTTRTGVKYKNIKGVKINEHPEEYTPKTSNWEWVIKNRIKHNTKTGKDYLVVAPINRGNNTITTYVLTTPEGVTNTIDKAAAEIYAVPSYWKEEKPAIMNITLENILLVK